MKKRGSTTLIIIAVICILIVGGILTYILIENNKQKFVCGDKICDSKEKLNPSLCPLDCQTECNEGDKQDYECPDGSEVDWCGCVEEKWRCIKSPEIFCEDNSSTSTRKIHFGMGSAYKFATELEDAGVEIVRNWINWRTIEPNNNDYDWTEMDEIVQSMNNAGIEIIGDFYGTPNWAHKNPGCTADICELKDMGEFREFAEKVAERYDGTKYTCGEQGNEFCGEMKYIEILNEPDQPVFFEKSNTNKYEEWLIAGYESVKKGNPNAQVLNGGFTNPITSESFVKNILENYNEYYDIVNFHIYETEADNTIATKQLKEWMADYEIDKPMWITETATLRLGNPDTLEEDLKEIAEAVIKRYTRSFGEGVDKVFWFTFLQAPVDGEAPPGVKTTNKIVGLGWVADKQSTIFNPRPAYYAFKTLAEKLAGFSSVTKLTDTQYKFIVDSKPVYVLWCDSRSCSVDSEITGSVKVTDYLGNEQAKDANTITLTESPIFVEEI